MRLFPGNRERCFKRENLSLLSMFCVSKILNGKVLSCFAILALWMSFRNKILKKNAFDGNIVSNISGFQLLIQFGNTKSFTWSSYNVDTFNK